MQAYLDAISTDLLEKIRLAFFVLLMVANFGVALGVILENEENPAVRRHAGWQILVMSLAAEIAFSALTFAIDLEVGRRHELTIAKLNTATEQERLERIKLETALKPREVSQQQWDSLVAKARGKLSSLNVYMAPDAEATRFGFMLGAAFEIAGVKSIAHRLSAFIPGMPMENLYVYGTEEEGGKLMDIIGGSGFSVGRFMPTDPLPGLSGPALIVGIRPPDIGKIDPPSWVYNRLHPDQQ